MLVSAPVSIRVTRLQTPLAHHRPGSLSCTYLNTGRNTRATLKCPHPRPPYLTLPYLKRQQCCTVSCSSSEVQPISHKRLPTAVRHTLTI